MTTPTLFDRIREARKRHNLTQSDFATLAGLRETYMSIILNHEPDLRMSTVQKIEAALRFLDEHGVQH